MAGFDIFDVLALLLGVLATVRKLDVSRRQKQDFPGVAQADFESWQSRESGVYTLIASACFAKLIVDLAFANYALKHPPLGLGVRLTAFSIDLVWLIVLVVAWQKRRRVRELRRSLGIDLSAPANKS